MNENAAIVVITVSLIINLFYAGISVVVIDALISAHKLTRKQFVNRTSFATVLTVMLTFITFLCFLSLGIAYASGTLQNKPQNTKKAVTINYIGNTLPPSYGGDA